MEIHQQRQADYRRGRNLTQGHLAKFVLVGSREAAEVQREGGGRTREVEPGVFRTQGELPQGRVNRFMVRRRRLPKQHVTEGDAGIVGAENDVQAPPRGDLRPALLEMDRELVVMVAYCAVVIDWIFPGGI